MRLHNADPPLDEAGLAVGEIHPPEPSKALVVAQIFQPRAGGLEVRAPAPQRLGVMWREVLESNRTQVRMPGDAACDHLERGQATVGKDVSSNEAPRGLLHRVGAVIDDDRLQQHAPVLREKARAALEERVEVAPPDRLDHLDRDELVVAPAQIAIVLA